MSDTGVVVTMVGLMLMAVAFLYLIYGEVHSYFTIKWFEKQDRKRREYENKPN